MAIRPLRLFPDPILSQPCKPIEQFNEDLEKLVQDLTDTLYHSPGVGIAAPQIGVSKQVSVIDIKRTKRDIIVLINPVILDGNGEQIPREGCLSVPDWLANIHRFQQVRVRTYDLTGAERLIMGLGFEALALQHEIDHLQGKLFLDRVTDLKTDLFRRKTYRKNELNG